MLGRFLGKKQTAKHFPKLPFTAWSLFGDPTRYFSAYPSSVDASWTVHDPDRAVFENLLGIAWLNLRPVRIVCEDRKRNQFKEWAEDAAKRLIAMAKATNLSGKNLNTALFHQSLDIWRSELLQFESAIHEMQDITFGRLNVFELAMALIRLNRQLNLQPFQWLNHEEKPATQEYYEYVRSGLNELHHYRDHWEDYRTIRMHHVIPQGQFPENEQEFLTQVMQLSKDISALIHALDRLMRRWWNAIQQINPAKQTLNRSLLNRYNLNSIPAEIKTKVGFDEFEQQVQALELQMRSLRWFEDFHGIQAISFEEIYQALTTWKTRVDQLTTLFYKIQRVADLEKWLLRFKGWPDFILQQASQIPAPICQDAWTAWFLEHWLSQTVNKDQLAAIQFNPKRNTLAHSIPGMAFQQYMSGIEAGVFNESPDSFFMMADGSSSEPDFPLTINISGDSDRVGSDAAAIVLCRSNPIPSTYSDLADFINKASEPDEKASIPGIFMHEQGGLWLPWRNGGESFPDKHFSNEPKHADTI